MFHVNNLGSHHGKSFSLHKPGRATGKEQNPGEVGEEGALPAPWVKSGMVGTAGEKMEGNFP